MHLGSGMQIASPGDVRAVAPQAGHKQSLRTKTERKAQQNLQH